MGRQQRYRRTAAVNVAANAAKLVIEGWLGLMAGSTALLADAADAVADLMTSSIALIWGTRSYAGRDRDHPHGHARIEPLVAFVIGGIMMVAGLRVGVEALTELVHGAGVRGGPVLVVGALLAALLKAGLHRYNSIQATALGSASLDALAADTLNDVYKSIGVAIGVAGGVIGYPVLDGLVGLAVSAVVLVQGGRIIRENTGYLTGGTADAVRLNAIYERILDDPDIHGAHDLVVHHLGTGFEVEVHAEVDGDIPLREAHAIETRLIQRLRAEEGVTDAHVHLDPSGIGEWRGTEGDED